jgi:HSP20 family protein
MMGFHHIPPLAKDTIETQIDRLFDDAIRGPSRWAPKCNVYEDGKTFCVQMAIPGMHAIHVEVEDHTLRVKGERKGELSEGRTWHARELQEGAFTWAFQLPSHVNPDGGHASYEEGILTITFPTREEAKSRQIMIQSPGAPLTGEDGKDGILKRSIIATTLFFAGLVGLGIWSA